MHLTVGKGTVKFSRFPHIIKYKQQASKQTNKNLPNLTDMLCDPIKLGEKTPYKTVSRFPTSVTDFISCSYFLLNFITKLSKNALDFSGHSLLKDYFFE